MKPLFKDPKTQRHYESKGYVVVPFLDEAAVARLTEFYLSLAFKSTGRGLCSVIGERPELLRPLRRQFSTVAADVIDRTFDRCDLVLGNFLVKQPNPAGVFPPHQDWSVVDESRDCTGVAWVPLADVDFASGAMGVLPGSRSVFPDVRCAPSAYGYKVLPYASYAMELFPYLDFQAMKAGDALVFDAGGVHGSLPNKGVDPRVVATFSVAPRGTGLSLSYFLPGTGLSKFERFEYQPESFVEYPNSRLMEMYEKGEKPSELKSLGVFDFRQTHISAQDAIARFEQAGCRRRDDIL
jgi:hypothetical protein